MAYLPVPASSLSAIPCRRAAELTASADPTPSQGEIYVPEEDVNYREEGLASWYGDDFHGRLTANGEVFDMASLSAAHPTLPMPCYARVTNLSNGKSLIVRVNDRGPYHGNRLMDVSSRAAELLEFKSHGVARVRVEYVGRAPLEGSDDRQLMATYGPAFPAPSPSLVRVASARPFVPQISSSARLIRGEVPLPEGRPYNLGNTSPDQASISATSEMYASATRVRTDVFWKIRARCRMSLTTAIPPAFGPSPPTLRSIRRANCWPDAGSIEPPFIASLISASCGKIAPDRRGHGA